MLCPRLWTLAWGPVIKELFLLQSIEVNCVFKFFFTDVNLLIYAQATFVF